MAVGGLPILPQQHIILDRSLCNGPYQPGPDVSPSPTPLHTSAIGPIPTPTPEAQTDPTCLALGRLAASNGVCSTRDHCTELHCELISVGAVDLSFEPCSNPPAIDVVVMDSSGNVLLNDTLTHSRVQRVNSAVVLNITIEQSPAEDSITLQVRFTCSDCIQWSYIYSPNAFRRSCIKVHLHGKFTDEFSCLWCLKVT